MKLSLFGFNLEYIDSLKEYGFFLNILKFEIIKYNVIKWDFLYSMCIVF